MYLAEALFGLSEGTDLSPVDGFGERQRVPVVERTPAQDKQLAGAKGLGHVEDQQ
jgi:hypothetical protein